MVYGIDGCKGGWDSASSALSPRLLAKIDDVLGLQAEVIAIDIPIGLPDSGPRVCDLVARKLLGKRRSSVFPAPLRGMLNAQTCREACEILY